jgi:hypothetical protein
MLNFVTNDTSTRVIKSLQSNPVRKLMVINLATMVAPRIAIASGRNKYAGQEAAFYEGVGLLTNYALPGLTALGTAYALDKFKNPLGVRSTGWAKTEYLDSFAKIYKNSVNAVYQKPIQTDMGQETLKRFIQNVLGSLEAPDPLQASPNKLNKQQLANFTADIQKMMDLPKKEAKAASQSIALKLAEALGSYDKLTLKADSEAVMPADTLIKHLSYLGKEFQKSHTSPTPAEITQNIGNIVKKLQKNTIAKSAVSMAAAIGLAFSVQFINRAITKRRTGQSGFVGYSDFGGKTGDPKTVAQGPSPVASSGPQLAGVYPAQPAMPSVSRSASQPPHFSGLIPNMQSSQFLPTVDQLKVMYGLAGIGRLLASRDMSEFRETLVLSGFGYINFLFLPNFVENLVAHSFKNKAIFSKAPEFNEKESGSFLEKLNRGFKRVNQSDIRSYQDIKVYSQKLGEQLAGKSESEIQKKLSTVLRKLSPELQNMSGLSTEAKAQKITAAVARELNGIKNVSTVSGIVYACLTLGIGLNLLNVYITNKKRARQLAEKAVRAQPPLPSNQPLPAPAGVAMGASPPGGVKNPFQAFIPA